MLSLARLTPHASATLSRGLFARAAPASAPLWARLRAGSVGTAELTTASAAGAPAHIETLDAFEEALKGADGKLVIVDFTATWCGPCKMIGPYFDSLASEYAGRALFIKVDVDANAETAADCGIRAMPTFQFYKNGGKVAEFAGADKAKLLSLITTHV